MPSPALVKICLKPHTGEIDSDAALAQYNALVRAHSAMQHVSALSVPQPYLVRPEIGLLVTEWVSGRSMALLLSSWHCREATAKEYMARGARWLRTFHASHALAPSHLDVDARLLGVAAIEATVAAPDDAFSRGLSELRHSARAAAAWMVPRSWIHGDFTPDNLIVSGSRTIGIDIHLRHESSIVYDVASFLNHLALTLCQPTGWLLARSHARLRTTFLANYLDGPEEQIALPLAWIQLYMLLQQWDSARARGRQSLRGALLNSCYRTVTWHLVRRISEYRAALE